MTSTRQSAAARTGAGATRVARAWRSTASERRLAAIAASTLFLTLFLPWYSQTGFATSTTARNLQPIYETLSGWGAFSFVEAAVLVVALSVLVLLFHRAEGRAFHLPGGDGPVITVAGAWTCFLVIWRMFDKQQAVRHGQYVFTTGIEWGIFITLLAAAFLAWTGTRIRAAHRPEPPLPGQEGVVFDGTWHARATPDDVRTQREARAAARAERRSDRGSRSSWRPSDAPAWSEPERPTGRLSAEPSKDGPEPTPPASADNGSDQLTIRLEDD